MMTRNEIEKRWRDSSPSYREKMRAYSKEYRRKNRQNLLDHERSLGRRFARSEWRAKKRGHDWKITIEAFSEMLVRPCFYCFGPLGISGVSLDRKDNALGYIDANVVPCCGNCNRIKCHLLTHQEMIVAMRAVRKLRTPTEEESDE